MLMAQSSDDESAVNAHAAKDQVERNRPVPVIDIYRRDDRGYTGDDVEIGE